MNPEKIIIGDRSMTEAELHAELCLPIERIETQEQAIERLEAIQAAIRFSKNSRERTLLLGMSRAVKRRWGSLTAARSGERNGPISRGSALRQLGEIQAAAVEGSAIRHLSGEARAKVLGLLAEVVSLLRGTSTR